MEEEIMVSKIFTEVKSEVSIVFLIGDIVDKEVIRIIVDIVEFDLMEEVVE